MSEDQDFNERHRGVPQSLELCAIDSETGLVTDAELHEGILAGIDPAAKARLLDATRKRAAEKYGWSAETIRRLYG